jgi:hypothetical protein
VGATIAFGTGYYYPPYVYWGPVYPIYEGPTAMWSASTTVSTGAKTEMCTGETPTEVGAITAMAVGIRSIHPLRGNKLRRDFRIVREILPRGQRVRDSPPSIPILYRDSTDLQKPVKEANCRHKDFRAFVVVAAVFAGRHQRRSTAFS